MALRGPDQVNGGGRMAKYFATYIIIIVLMTELDRNTPLDCWRFKSETSTMEYQPNVLNYPVEPSHHQWSESRQITDETEQYARMLILGSNCAVTLARFRPTALSRPEITA